MTLILFLKQSKQIGTTISFGEIDSKATISIGGSNSVTKTSDNKSIFLSPNDSTIWQEQEAMLLALRAKDFLTWGH